MVLVEEAGSFVSVRGVDDPGLRPESGKLLDVIAVSCSDLQSLSAGCFEPTKRGAQYCGAPSPASPGEPCCQAANVRRVKRVIWKSEPLRARDALRQRFTFKVAPLPVLATSCHLALPLAFPLQKVTGFTF